MVGSVNVVGRVEQVLGDFLAERRAALIDISPDLAPVADAATRFVLDGGKRLRPQFAYWGWRAVRDGSADASGVFAAGAALELLHACALVHDDVMDASDTRRGRPSAHRAFEATHRAGGWAGAPATFGTGAAILLGDLLLAWADHLLARADVPDGSRAAYAQLREQVTAGQFLDLLEQARGGDATAALLVIAYKTSKYTIEGPLHLGALAGRAGEGTLAALSAYGLALGEAFQLRDDLLGAFGDPGRTGKPAGDDLREGKRTLLVAWAQEAGADLTGLGRPDADVDELVARVEASGARARVEARITDQACCARAALDSADIRDEARVALDRLAVAATDRAH